MALISLEPEAREVCERAKRMNFVPTTISINVVRQRLALEQKSPVYLHQVQFKAETIDLGPKLGQVRVYLLFPTDIRQDEQLPVVFYIHGGQFIAGDHHSYNKLIREITVRSRVCLVFPEYSLAPEAQAPVQNQQLLAVFKQLPLLAAKYHLNLRRLILSGDDVGGGMAVSLALQTEAQQLPIYKMCLFYPVVNYNFDTFSYISFAGGYSLTRTQMKWSWDHYLGPQAAGNSVDFSPLLAAKEQLAALPETLVISAEADVVRDEGEALARKIRDAHVKTVQIRLQATIHDFVLKNELDTTDACRLAMNVAVDWIRPHA
ncbi:lipase [Ligilactobacillus pabuli]|uniref:Lipase n=1 Tax=Ligilactobacillus pabuli TaxID=2886039 RepID=A0ABQ5JEJ3_9LACO|nr:alpha/beta hydrolase fold domain-containing protein [Ligilactobacillus pabuli]GKS80484.1 lipase [Ligilactobacillus pabuli]HIW89512.1 alpha/beta hydrolase [Candidatus Ligilactobacillus excrementipullorum]